MSRPLFVSQGFASAAGAGSMIFAAAYLDPGEFALFTLIALASTTLVGLVRAALYQPALIEQRRDPTALVPFRYAIIACAGAAAALAGAAAAFGVVDPLLLVLIGVSALFPTLHDWLRFRAIGIDRRWEPAVADGIRLALVLLSPLVLIAAPNAAIYQVFLGLSTALPFLYLRVRLPVLTVFARFADYRRAASLQLTEYVVGQFTSTVPLLVLGVLGSTPLLAGIRLAQTLLGPLNLVFTASTTGLIADGATRTTHAGVGSLVSRGKAVSRRLGFLSIGIVLVLALVVWLSRIDLNGVANTPLLAGLILVGIYTIGSRGATVHAVLMRLLGRHELATVGRTVLVVASLVAFALGYLLGGIDASLIAGFLAAAVVTPLVFSIPGERLYRRLLKEEDDSRLEAEAAAEIDALAQSPTGADEQEPTDGSEGLESDDLEDDPPTGGSAPGRP
ncbi:hypothetical protein DDQ50_05360 [Amnibacterium flavum]|uniref:Polysaccharide biosynthesis protein n=2 Tax=Amnibacterium flavum TaxID=2173173 RepID=A0A2V1HZ37_9MICO|nr:hypothetical protein DDQ50_05360 [Amnibacterium flavum]